jgi:hypothetical protein
MSMATRIKRMEERVEDMPCPVCGTWESLIMVARMDGNSYGNDPACGRRTAPGAAKVGIWWRAAR